MPTRQTRTRTSSRTKGARAAAPRAAKSSGTKRRLGGAAVALGTLSLGAIVAAVGTVLLGRRRIAGDGSFGSGEHAPVDLMGETHPGPNERAPEAFRPDPTAPIPEGERDAFRPALAGVAGTTER